MIQQGNINIKNWYYDRENGGETKERWSLLQVASRKCVYKLGQAIYTVK